MSITTLEERSLDIEIHHALNTRDNEALYQLAEVLAESDEEEASRLKAIARRFDEEDGAYDQVNN